jgi:hypothetical protein
LNESKFIPDPLNVAYLDMELAMHSDDPNEDDGEYAINWFHTKQNDGLIDIDDETPQYLSEMNEESEKTPKYDHASMGLPTELFVSLASHDNNSAENKPSFLSRPVTTAMLTNAKRLARKLFNKKGKAKKGKAKCEKPSTNNSKRPIEIGNCDHQRNQPKQQLCKNEYSRNQPCHKFVPLEKPNRKACDRILYFSKSQFAPSFFNLDEDFQEIDNPYKSLGDVIIHYI